MQRYPSPDAADTADWLLDVANRRGATVVYRPPELERVFEPPPRETLSDADLVVGLCRLDAPDRPQYLRPACQLISRGQIDPGDLILAARRERVGAILADLARKAIHVDPAHELWKAILHAFPDESPPRSTLLHWTRLAEPVFERGQPSRRWRLVA
jgi:hypothetical protein